MKIDSYWLKTLKISYFYYPDTKKCNLSILSPENEILASVMNRSVYSLTKISISFSSFCYIFCFYASKCHLKQSFFSRLSEVLLRNFYLPNLKKVCFLPLCKGSKMDSIQTRTLINEIMKCQIKLNLLNKKQMLKTKWDKKNGSSYCLMPNPICSMNIFLIVSVFSLRLMYS